jgi:hypothetical protein
MLNAVAQRRFDDEVSCAVIDAGILLCASLCPPAPGAHDQDAFLGEKLNQGMRCREGADLAHDSRVGSVDGYDRPNG